MKYPRMKLTKDQLRWNITPTEREKLVKAMMRIINDKDPECSRRDKTSAMKNLLLCCAQDIDIMKTEEPVPDVMTIRIEEVDYSPPIDPPIDPSIV